LCRSCPKGGGVDPSFDHVVGAGEQLRRYSEPERLRCFEIDHELQLRTLLNRDVSCLQAALNLPLKPGSRVLVGSSGAAVSGSPMSGGYAGAKRMLWIMAKYANGVSAAEGLGIHFQAIVPLQIIGGTGVGDAGANAYAGAMGMKPEQFLARFGAPLPPREFGEKVVTLLDDPKYADGVAFGLKGDTGITVLDEGAAA
jgi:hypothetical protein